MNNIMEFLRNKMREEGLDDTVKYLMSNELSDAEKAEFVKYNVFNGGFVSLSLLCSL